MAIGLAACGGGGSGDGPGPQPLHLTIGNLVPLSGPSKPLGTSGEKASQLALSEIEQAARTAGADHTVRITNEDEGSGGTSASEAAKRLVQADGATCLTGPWTSEAAAQVAQDVSIPSEVLQISPLAADADLAGLNDHDLVNSTALPTSVEGDALATAVGDSLGGIKSRTVEIATGPTADSKVIAGDFAKAWQDQDGTLSEQLVLGTPLPPTAGPAPDASLVVADSHGYASFLPLLPNPMAGTTWGSDQLVSPGLPKAVGRKNVDGLSALAPGTPDGAAPSVAFNAAIRQAAPSGVKPAPYAAQQFDATILCYLAAVAAGSTDGRKMADELIDITAPGGTVYSWLQLPEAIRALENGDDIDYTGASGPIDMDVHGNASRGVFGIYRYSSGRLEQVGEVPVSKPNPAIP